MHALLGVTLVAACGMYVLTPHLVWVLQSVTLEYRMDQTVATADSPPVVLGQMPHDFVQKMGSGLRYGLACTLCLGICTDTSAQSCCRHAFKCWSIHSCKHQYWCRPACIHASSSSLWMSTCRIKHCHCSNVTHFLLILQAWKAVEI